MTKRQHEQSRALFERAEAVIPGGIYGHQTPRLLTRGAFPSFLAEAAGSRVRDVDGNSYIDFLCGYGPIVLGYNHDVVEQAAARQRERGDTMTLPAEVTVELAERLVELTPGADWCVFAKNGSDVCTWSLAVARAATRREVVAMADHAYHGIHGWCNHLKTGFLDSERSAIRRFEWNDLASLERIFAEETDDVAAVILTPFRHELLEDSVLPAPGFLESVRQLCTRFGALLIVDDVRAGFRLNLGGSTQRWGVTPDLLLYSKAVANGYPLSVMLGAGSLRAAAESVFMTGTFYLQAVPLAAALATVNELVSSNGIERMERAGRRLCGRPRGARRGGRLRRGAERPAGDSVHDVSCRRGQLQAQLRLRWSVRAPGRSASPVAQLVPLGRTHGSRYRPGPRCRRRVVSRGPQCSSDRVGERVGVSEVSNR